MIGIVLIAHAHIARETKGVVEHVLGVQQGFEVVDVPDSDVSEAAYAKLQSLLVAMNSGQGVLVMVDLFGATPCNIAAAASQAVTGEVAVISGFNVPAVIKAISLRQQGVELQALATQSIAAGQQYMCLLTETQNTKADA